MSWYSSSLSTGQRWHSTTGQRWQNMLESISMKEDERHVAIAKHTEIHRALQQKAWVNTVFLTGSYSRKTALHPLHDVDMFCVIDTRSLPGGISPDNPQHLLRILQRALQEHFPSATANLQKHSIGLKFPNERITYDVIPATQQRGAYLIPERGETRYEAGHMILSNPRAVEDLLQKQDRISGGRLIPQVRLMKKWNELNCKKIKNFHMELLCYDAARTLAETSSSKESCKVLFTHLSQAVKQDCNVPGVHGYGGVEVSQVNLKDTRSAFQFANVSGELGAAARKAQLAIDAEARGDSATAHRLWSDIFGTIY